MLSGSSPTAKVTGQPVQALGNPDEEPPTLVELAEEVEVAVLLDVVVRVVPLVDGAPPLVLPPLVLLLVVLPLMMSGALLLPPELLPGTDAL